MTKGLVFFDLDGTLLDRHKQLPAANREALAALKANGYIPIINTGRNRWEITNIMDEGGIDSLIGANGADIWLNGEHYSTSPIGVAQMKRFTALANEKNLPVAYYNDHDVVLSQHNAGTEKNYQIVVQTQPRVDTDYYLTHPITMMLLYAEDTPEGNALAAEIQAQFPELDFYRNGYYALDVVNHDISKASGIATLTNNARFAGVPTYGFGDGNNDIPMLKHVDTGIAMGNALPAVAAVADYQTDDYEANGIPNALKHFGLI